MKITKLYKEFFESEKAGGLILLIVTILSLIISNSQFQSVYLNFWNTNILDHSLVHWINDGLMTIFFLMIGLELEREIYKGELSNIKNAALPIFAAIGGIIIPASIFMIFNYGLETQSGAGIPMATDIAFAIGILSLLGSRIPNSLKIFLTALAVIDDLGAILVIAVFYTKVIVWKNLIISLAIFILLIGFNKAKVRNLIPYLIGGFFMWYFMLSSGVHATITGVLLAFAVPFGNSEKEEESTSYILQHFLHKPVAFFILPLFAIANTCIPIPNNWSNALFESNSLGIIIGLIIGKPLGIFLFSLLGVGLGFCSLPSDLKWKNILGVGFLGGIGFTMSIFVTLLAFQDGNLINSSKIAILVASTVGGLIGYILLSLMFKKEINLDNK